MTNRRVPAARLKPFSPSCRIRPAQRRSIGGHPDVFAAAFGRERLERISGADFSAGDRESRAQPLEDACLSGAGGDEMKRVNGALLADAIDATDALLEPHRIPWQLEIDDEPA